MTTTNNDKVNAARWREVLDVLIQHKDRIVELHQFFLDLDKRVKELEELGAMKAVPMKDEAFIDHSGRVTRVVDTAELIRRYEAAANQSIDIKEIEGHVTESSSKAEQSEGVEGIGGTPAGEEAKQEAEVQGKKRGRPPGNRGKHIPGGGADER